MPHIEEIKLIRVKTEVFLFMLKYHVRISSLILTQVAIDFSCTIVKKELMVFKRSKSQRKYGRLITEYYLA